MLATLAYWSVLSAILAVIACAVVRLVMIDAKMVVLAVTVALLLAAGARYALAG